MGDLLYLVQSMSFNFKRLYFLNLDHIPKYSNDQKRIQRLKIINYFFVLSVPVVIVNDLVLAITGKQAYTFEKYPALIFWLICLLALYFTRKRIFLPSKLIVVFVPLLFISTYALTDYIIGEHFLWQPIMLLGISVIPFLVFDVKKERNWLIIAFLSFFFYTIFHDDIMLFGADEGFTRVYNRLNTTPFVYNSVRIIIFIFLTVIMYYSVRINDRQQEIYEEINTSLLKTSDEVKSLNAELNAQRNAINNSASLIIADEDEKIVYANDIYLSISGFAHEEMIGTTLPELLEGGRESSLYNQISEKLKERKVWRGEIRFQSKKEQYFWMETAVSTIEDNENNPKGFLIIMFNISKLKEDEERLERLNHEKDRILYAVAHDLKNPLLNFKTLLEMLTSGKVKRWDVEEIYRLMARDCDHSTNLIAELLEIGRLEDNDYVLIKKPTNLNEFLHNSIDRFKKQAESKSIEVVLSFDKDIKIVNINEKEFVRVIYNLISNAIKFTPTDGQISISTKLVDDRITIKIADTGVGISKELLPIIFDKFSKASRSGVEGERSTGLGMWIVRHIVSLHGGEITVESVEKQGTTFTISLPR